MRCNSLLQVTAEWIGALPLELCSMNVYRNPDHTAEYPTGTMSAAKSEIMNEQYGEFAVIHVIVED